MKKEKTYYSESIDTLDSLSESIIKDIHHPIILFIGELGAGKTTLIKALVNQFGTKDQVSSPSYAIINVYNSGDDNMYHIDLYRLKDAQEAFQLGIEEILYSGSYCFIEWPQLIRDYIDEPYHVIKIEHQQNNMRKITLV